MYRSSRGIGLYFLYSMLFCSVLFAAGSTEDTAPDEYLYPESILYICSLDSASLEASQDLISNSLVKSLARKLGTIQFRVRNDEELNAYSLLVLHKNITELQEKLQKKRKERDMLIFKGYKDWKYTTEREKLDAEIKLLEENLDTVAADIPLIHKNPRFQLAQENIQGVHEGLTADSDRVLFAKKKKADILLYGSINDYYGRFYVRLQLYSSVQEKLLYDDSFLFSPENQTEILDTMYRRLLPVLSGKQVSYISVSTVPEQSSISLGSTYSGSAPVSLLPVLPGQLSFSVFTEAYKHFSSQLDIKGAMDYKISVALEPIALNALDIVSESDVSIYLNGVYQGSAPTRIQIPENTYSNISIVDSRDREALVLVPGTTGTLLIEEDLMSVADLRVEDSRKQFYDAYGRFWIALPTAFILGGLSTAYVDAAKLGGNPDMRNAALSRYYISAGAWVVTACFLVESIYRIGRYVYTAESKSSSIPETLD